MFSCSVMSNSVTLCTAACQTPLSIRFSWQEYWIAISSLRSYSQPRDQIISCISSGFFTAEPQASIGIVPSVEFISVPQLCLTLWAHGLQHSRLNCPSPTAGACSDSCIESVMPSNHLILCHLLLFLPSIFSNIRVFFNESKCHDLSFWNVEF